MSIFTESKLNEVFYRAARFPGESKHAFIHAPFDRVTILGQTYCQPRTFAGANGASGNMASAYWMNTGVIDNQESKADGRDLWYTELNPIVMEEHELGAFDSRPNDWTGCFSLNLI
jgi:hypothetical protein